MAVLLSFERLCTDDLDAAVATADAVVREVRDVPTGRNATVLLAGVRVELVEWSAEQWREWEARDGRGDAAAEA